MIKLRDALARSLVHPFYVFVVSRIVKTYNIPRLMDKASYLRS